MTAIEQIKSYQEFAENKPMPGLDSKVIDRMAGEDPKKIVSSLTRHYAQMDGFMTMVKAAVVEFRSAIKDGDLSGLSSAKEHYINAQCLMIFTAVGSLMLYGFDIDEAMSRVYDSLMSNKFRNDRPSFDACGRLIFGPNYELPKLSDLV